MLHPYFLKPRAKAAPKKTTWTVPALCKAYDWPSGLSGGGVIGIFEAAGGWVASDMATFFAGIGQPVPLITDVSVDSTVNSKQSPKNDADYEVALDIQVSAAAYYVATGKAATIRIYWGQDIAAAITKAASDGCAVFSCSWGDDEANWGNISCEAMETAAIAATAAGMTIFAAAGDNSSADGGQTPANVDCPGSCPHVICCGGTTKTATTETVWEDNPGKTDGEGTGGGYSTVFPIQAWQIGAPLAPTKEQGEKSPGKGRMVPDVTGNADPVTGYSIVVYGSSTIVGGTSAVAPLYSGLCAAVGKKVGFAGPLIWELANRPCFTDITVGSNGEFKALAGPDPCSGVGVLIAAKLAAVL